MKPKQKFPLCSKYGLEPIKGIDVNRGEEGWSWVLECAEVEQALAQAEKSALEIRCNICYEAGKQQGKLDQSFLSADKNLGKNEYGSGALFLTSGGRIVRDDHNGESFRPPIDILVMSAKELTQGISFAEFKRRLKSQLEKKVKE